MGEGKEDLKEERIVDHKCHAVGKGNNGEGQVCRGMEFFRRSREE